MYAIRLHIVTITGQYSDIPRRHIPNKQKLHINLLHYQY